MPGFHFNRNEKWTCEHGRVVIRSYSMQIHPDPNITKFGDKFGISGSWRRPQSGTGRYNWGNTKGLVIGSPVHSLITPPNLQTVPVSCGPLVLVPTTNVPSWEPSHSPVQARNVELAI